MKRVLQFAFVAMMLFAACSKEELTPPPLIQEQGEPESVSVKPGSEAVANDKVFDDYITLEEPAKTWKASWMIALRSARTAMEFSYQGKSSTVFR